MKFEWLCALLLLSCAIAPTPPPEYLEEHEMEIYSWCEDVVFEGSPPDPGELAWCKIYGFELQEEE